MIAWLALVLGFAVLAIAALGYRKAFRLRLSRGHRLAVWTLAQIGGAMLSLALGYPLYERTRVYGVSLSAAVFQRYEDGARLADLAYYDAIILFNFVVYTGAMLYVACVVMARRIAKQSQATAHGG